MPGLLRSDVPDLEDAQLPELGDQGVSETTIETTVPLLSVCNLNEGVDLHSSRMSDHDETPAGTFTPRDPDALSVPGNRLSAPYSLSSSYLELDHDKAPSTAALPTMSQVNTATPVASDPVHTVGTREGAAVARTKASQGEVIRNYV